MTIDQVIPYISMGVAVAAVVYGYVKGKNANDIVSTLTTSADEALKLQSTIVNTLLAMKEPLEAAVRQLPKTRAKRGSKGVE